MTEEEEVSLSQEELVALCRESVCPECDVHKEAEGIRLRALADAENVKKRLLREAEELKSTRVSLFWPTCCRFRQS